MYTLSDESAMASTAEINPALIKPARKPALPALTGIRTFLAVNIVFFHFSNPAWFGPFAPVVNNGYTGVSFFFLLSGFILSYNYADRGGSLNKREFWLARFSRLYPVYILSLLISFHMLQMEWQYQTRTHFIEGIILTPLLLQGFSPLLATFWNTVAWTLSSEVMLYIAFPWLVKMKWPQSARKLILIVIGCWLVGLILPSLYVWINPDGLAHADRFSGGMWLRALKFTPPPYILTFFAGLMLGKLQNVLVLSKWQRFAVALTGVVAAALFYHYLVAIVPYPMVHGGMMTPIFALIIIGLGGPHPISGFFGWKPFVLIGEATYCLYLLHFNSWNLIHDHHLWDHLHLVKYDPWVSYILLVVIALAAYHLVENPCRKWILSRWSHKASAKTN